MPNQAATRTITPKDAANISRGSPQSDPTMRAQVHCHLRQFIVPLCGRRSGELDRHCCVHAVSATTCGKIIDLSLHTVLKFNNTARLIMVAHALWWERDFLEEHLGKKTCDFETDEAQVFSSWEWMERCESTLGVFGGEGVTSSQSRRRLPLLETKFWPSNCSLLCSRRWQHDANDPAHACTSKPWEAPCTLMQCIT